MRVNRQRIADGDGLVAMFDQLTRTFIIDLRLKPEKYPEVPTTLQEVMHAWISKQP